MHGTTNIKYPQLVPRSRMGGGMPQLPVIPSWHVQVCTFYEHEIYYISIFFLKNAHRMLT